MVTVKGQNQNLHCNLWVILTKLIILNFFKTEIATGKTVEIKECTQSTLYLCCKIDLINTENDPCNKLTSCANPKDSTNISCDPRKQNGDYMCQV
jgi:hypothetical protein